MLSFSLNKFTILYRIYPNRVITSTDWRLVVIGLLRRVGDKDVLLGGSMPRTFNCKNYLCPSFCVPQTALRWVKMVNQFGSGGNKKTLNLSRVFLYRDPGSNRDGHICPRDFKSFGINLISPYELAPIDGDVPILSVPIVVLFS